MRWMWLPLVLVGCETECEEVTWYVDADGDTYGAAEPVVGCVDEQPATAVSNPGDCNDADPAIHPDATEVCNGLDDDCDDDVDDADTDTDPSSMQSYYVDDDGDTFGAGDQAALACVPPAGAVEVGGDCDDGDKAVFPGAPEDCKSPADMNCDGVAPTDDLDKDLAVACEDCDDSDPAIGLPTPWYLDMDEDLYGDASEVVEACDQPKGYVALSGDCRDDARAINPGAAERCDRIDNDCDELIDDDDDDVVNPPRWYVDRDGDLFGNADLFVEQCAQLPGTVSNGGDCDDGDKEVGAAWPWYLDDDEDGYGDERGTPSEQLHAAGGPGRQQRGL